MPFVRRFTEVQPLEVIRQIEGSVIIDLAPPAPATGAGNGAVLLVGEFEDGYFATDELGPVEVFGSADQQVKFGGFGFTYANVPSNNPCARRHVQENWNGNGFLKGYRLKAQRLMIARVDTSVGSVSFDPLASISGGVGPFAMTVGGVLTVTSNTGGPANSTALTAVVATSAGAAASFATIVSGDSFGIRIDGGVQTTVVFGGGDTTQAAVIARINTVLGFACAVANATQVDLRGIQAGTGGSVVLVELVAGVLAKAGHVVGTTVGTGSVANINAVTVTEINTIVNGSAALTAINIGARIGPLGELRLVNTTTLAAASLNITSTPMALTAKLSPIGTTVLISSHPAGTIRAGTRVRTVGGLEWVTMQTLDVTAGALGPYTVRVRPATDDGTALGTGASSVTVLVDQSNIGTLVVNNAAALTAALTEPQLDAAYQAALDQTLAEAKTVRDANFLLIARRSDAVVYAGRSNALAATSGGLSARIYITGDPLGTSTSTTLTNVAKFRSDRVFYTGKGLKVTVAEIAVRGLAGGVGFTEDGVITVRPDGPLTTVCAILAPETNPGQPQALITDFFDVDAGGELLTIESYIAFKASGVVVPRNDRSNGMEFQSGVTSTLESGKTTCARRKMADYIQNSLVLIANPYVKKLSTQARRDKLRGQIGGFLSGLQSLNAPDLQRIAAFSIDDSVNAGNTADVLALGVYYINIAVRTLSSLDDIVMQTEIGENAVIVTEV